MLNYSNNLHSLHEVGTVYMFPQVNSNNSTEWNIVQPSGEKVHHRYTVKIINFSKKSEYTVEKMDKMCQFTLVTDLKEKLAACLCFPIEEVGYILPGHGLKAKMRLSMKKILVRCTRYMKDVKTFYLK